MKFYQTVVSLIFFFMYTTTTFGAEETINVPKEILELIDQFQFEKNCYKETGHREIRDKERGGIAISSSSCRIVFESGAEAFYLSLSDMKKTEGKLTCSEMRPYSQQFLLSKYFSLFPDEKLIGSDERGKLVYRMIEGRLTVVRGWRASDNSMCSSKMLEKITSSDVSEDRKTIVTRGEGNIRKWEFQKCFKINDIFPDGKVTVSTPSKYGIRKAEKRIFTSIIVNFLLFPFI